MKKLTREKFLELALNELKRLPTKIERSAQEQVESYHPIRFTSTPMPGELDMSKLKYQ